MIFSEEKWNDADEIRPFINASNALDFKTVQAPLLNAFELFIRPLIGDVVSNLIIAIYTDGLGTEYPEENKKLLFLTQRANALLAFWYDYDEMQVLIASSGVKRQESEKAKTPYKYQEQNLKSGWHNKGFDALDDLLRFLEESISIYPDYKDSPNYTIMLTSIVRNTSEVNEIYSINSSRIIFLRLRAHFKTIEDTIILPRLGEDLFNEFKAGLAIDEPEEKYKKLRKVLVPVVVYYAIARLIRETGSITDKGLYFPSLNGGSDSYAASSPVSDDRLVSQANRAESDAISYWKMAEKILKSEFDVISSSGKRIPDRDNNGKRSFWA